MTFFLPENINKGLSAYSQDDIFGDHSVSFFFFFGTEIWNCFLIYIFLNGNFLILISLARKLFGFFCNIL